MIKSSACCAVMAFEGRPGRPAGTSVSSTTFLFTLSRAIARRTARFRQAGPPGGFGPGRRHCRAGPAGISRKRERLRRRTGRPGSLYVHLQGTAATGHRARRRRKNHRHAHPGSGVDRQRRHVVGLAPSAAAAAQLRDATGAPADTLAKLTWSIRYGDLPDWANASAGPRW